MNETTQAAWSAFSQELHRFILSRISKPEDADDVLQEAFVRLMEKPPAGQSHTRGWLYRVVRNLIADYYRKHSIHDPIDELDPVDEERFEVSETEAFVSSWLRPMALGLPDKYREALMMADFEGATMAQIAERLELSLSGAKSRVQRARGLLVKDLHDCCSFHFDHKGRVTDWWHNQKPCEPNQNGHSRC